ncbi:hypothetical protein SC1_01940 [Sphingopyxis sp. C-1]|nr:hypothetical protein SC1_01940 [Sphingopyxis sp. C-1]
MTDRNKPALIELLEKADRAILIPSSDVPALEDAIVEMHRLIQRLAAPTNPESDHHG